MIKTIDKRYRIEQVCDSRDVVMNRSHFSILSYNDARAPLGQDAGLWRTGGFGCETGV